MANPSTIWAQLALPYSPVGCVPFVADDGVTIVTDVLNFNYCSTTATPSTPDVKPNQLTVAGGIRVRYTDATLSLTPLINKPAGLVAIGAGANSVAVTCSYCTLRSLVFLQIKTPDATLTRVTVQVADGIFLITGNANATGAVTIEFFIVGTA